MIIGEFGSFIVERITSPMMIAEILVFIIIQTKLPREGIISKSFFCWIY